MDYNEAFGETRKNFKMIVEEIVEKTHEEIREATQKGIFSIRSDLIGLTNSNWIKESALKRLIDQGFNVEWPKETFPPKKKYWFISWNGIHDSHVTCFEKNLRKVDKLPPEVEDCKIVYQNDAKAISEKAKFSELEKLTKWIEREICNFSQKGHFRCRIDFLNNYPLSIQEEAIQLFHHRGFKISVDRLEGVRYQIDWSKDWSQKPTFWEKLFGCG